MKYITTTQNPVIVIFKLAKIVDQNWIQLLHPQELVQLSKLPQNYQPDWLTGRIALKLAYLNFKSSRQDLNQIITTHKKTGEPAIYRQSDLYCSVSHSGQVGQAAVSLSPIGVDIEIVRNRHPKLLDFISTFEELEFFKELKTAYKISMVWTIKESIMKAEKKGLQILPQQIRIKQKSGNLYKSEVIINNQTHRWKTRLILKSKIVASITIPEEQHDKLDIGWDIPLPSGSAQSPSVAQSLKSPKYLVLQKST